MRLSNLPPGVRDSDIPGDRPQDVAWDHAAEEVDIEQVCAENRGGCSYARQINAPTATQQERAMLQELYPDSGVLFGGCGADALETPDGTGDPARCLFWTAKVEGIAEAYSLREYSVDADVERALDAQAEAEAERSREVRHG